VNQKLRRRTISCPDLATRKPGWAGLTQEIVATDIVQPLSL